MKILITGSTGMLGMDLVNACKAEHEVVGVGSSILDITDMAGTISFVKAARPDVIIHAAAYADVDGCETNVEKAFSVNALGARNVAIGAAEAGAAMVYISTDYVYDGTKTAPYFEYDNTNPLSVYGRSKLEGENFVKSILDKYYIVRASWLFGRNGKNFVRTMLELSKSRDSLQIVDDQVGSPTFTADLAQGLKQLAESGCYGTYHLTNSEYCSWYEFAKLIFELQNINHVKVAPITTAELKRPAARPMNSRLEKFYWKLNGFKELRSYKEAVGEYIKNL